jgi:hypothetical protein
MSRQIENMRKLHAGELDEIEEFGITFVRESRAVAAEQRVAELEREYEGLRIVAVEGLDERDRAEAERDALRGAYDGIVVQMQAVLKAIDEGVAKFPVGLSHLAGMAQAMRNYIEAEDAALAASVSKEETRDAVVDPHEAAQLEDGWA